MTVDFDFTVSGASVEFHNYTDVSGVGLTPLWNFGDNSLNSNEVNPVHVYANPGVYQVTLSYIDTQNKVIASSKATLTASDKVRTFLSDSIYNLIEAYMPEDIMGPVSHRDKRMFIEKWQLYIYPLVNHFIPTEEYKNEGYYEALENQLIMELAAYDYMLLFVSNMYKGAAKHITDSVVSSTGHSESDGKAEGDIKHITTGPTEVEYFDSNGNNADYATVLNRVLQPGGMIDNLKASLCMLASRLEIYLPICHNPAKIIKAPRVVNRRKPGPLDGPDPALPVRKNIPV